MVSESCVTWATSVSILVFMCLSVLDLGPLYATDVRQTDVRRASSLNASALWGRGHKNRINLLLSKMCLNIMSKAMMQTVGL